MFGAHYRESCARFVTLFRNENVDANADPTAFIVCSLFPFIYFPGIVFALTLHWLI